MREWNEGDWDDLIQEWNDLSDDQLELMIDNDIETENVINERVMNLMQRKRAALKMRRLKFRIARARKIKRKRFATMDMLTRRARRKARQFVRKRIAGKMGEKYVDLSPSQIPHSSTSEVPPHVPEQSCTQSLLLSVSQVPHSSS